MARVTTDLQNTVRANRHIENVYFDKEGDFYFNVHEHKGKKYHRIKKQVVTDRAKQNARPETVVEAKPEHQIVEVLTRAEVLSAKAENEVPLTSEAQAMVESIKKELADAKEQIEKLSKESGSKKGKGKTEKDSKEAEDEKELADAIAKEEAEKEAAKGKE